MKLKYLTLILTLTQLTFTWDWPWSNNKPATQQANLQQISPNPRTTQQSVWSKISNYFAQKLPSKQNNLKQCVMGGCKTLTVKLQKLLDRGEPQNSLIYRNANLELNRCINSCEAKT